MRAPLWAEVIRICDVCGGEFKPTRSRQKRCSKVCRAKIAHRRKAVGRLSPFTPSIQSLVTNQGQRALYRSVMALCSECHIPGPAALLRQHGLLEHGKEVDAAPWPDTAGIYSRRLS